MEKIINKRAKKRQTRKQVLKNSSKSYIVLLLQLKLERYKNSRFMM